MHRIETTRGQPDLARVVAAWLVAAAFGYPGGRPPAQGVACILAPPNGPAETFALFEPDRPVGTAGLGHNDRASRPRPGWQPAGPETDRGKDVVLMIRHLSKPT